MKTLSFVIPGIPQAKKRARFGQGRAYNSQTSDEDRFKWEIKRQLPKGFNIFPKGTPLSLVCVFALPIPKSSSKKQQQSMLSGEIKHVGTPDLDNCIKYIKDCLNKIVWHDDCQVVKETSIKGYSDTPQTAIYIREAQTILDIGRIIKFIRGVWNKMKIGGYK